MGKLLAQQRIVTLIRPPSVNRQKDARTTLTRFFYLNRCNSFPVPTRISYNRHQDQKVLHQTLIEVHTATDAALAAAAQTSSARPGNSIVPSCRPIQKSGLVFAHGAVGTGLGEGQNTTETDDSRFIYVRSRTGLQSRKQFPEYWHSDRTALAMAHCFIAGRRACSLISALVGPRAAPVPSSSTPWPGTCPG
jgi:hypothetical protein